mmetsp:Transcript_11524/g.24190  ORF Transcript_11524/g.24190 Transcript_11524/m.24190 type:complete len:182 (-) Transcript_11524:72-617(-)
MLSCLRMGGCIKTKHQMLEQSEKDAASKLDILRATNAILAYVLAYSENFDLLTKLAPGSRLEVITATIDELDSKKKIWSAALAIKASLADEVDETAERQDFIFNIKVENGRYAVVSSEHAITGRPVSIRVLESGRPVSMIRQEPGGRAASTYSRSSFANVNLSAEGRPMENPSDQARYHCI